MRQNNAYLEMEGVTKNSWGNKGDWQIERSYKRAHNKLVLLIRSMRLDANENSEVNRNWFKSIQKGIYPSTYIPYDGVMNALENITGSHDEKDKQILKVLCTYCKLCMMLQNNRFLKSESTLCNTFSVINIDKLGKSDIDSQIKLLNACIAYIKELGCNRDGKIQEAREQASRHARRAGVIFGVLSIAVGVIIGKAVSHGYGFISVLLSMMLIPIVAKMAYAITFRAKRPNELDSLDVESLNEIPVYASPAPLAFSIDNVNNNSTQNNRGYKQETQGNETNSEAEPIQRQSL